MHSTNIHYLQTYTEYQVFVCESERIEAKALVIIMIAMANAGSIEIAIAIIIDDRTISGVDGCEKNLKNKLTFNLLFCVPFFIIDILYICILVYLRQHLKKIGYSRDTKNFFIGDGKYVNRCGNEDVISASAILFLESHLIFFVVKNDFIPCNYFCRRKPKNK